jgi:hypothetical protein
MTEQVAMGLEEYAKIALDVVAAAAAWAGHVSH